MRQTKNHLQVKLGQVRDWKLPGTNQKTNLDTHLFSTLHYFHPHHPNFCWSNISWELFRINSPDFNRITLTNFPHFIKFPLLSSDESLESRNAVH